MSVTRKQVCLGRKNESVCGRRKAVAVGVKVRVWGDYALFSRPEMKVERCSYDVMTPCLLYTSRCV